MDKQPDPRNAPGDFLVEADVCIVCGAPGLEAPDLIRTEKDGCYFFKQPESREEIESACQAVVVSCCQGVQYCGKDPAIVRRIAQLNRDVLRNLGTRPWWKFW